MNMKDLTVRFKNWRNYRRSYEELASYSDRDLDDIGIRRVDIARVLRQGRR